MPLTISRNLPVHNTQRAAAIPDRGEETRSASGQYPEARRFRDTVELSPRSQRIAGDRPLAEIVEGLRAVIGAEDWPASAFPPLRNAFEGSGEEDTAVSSQVSGMRKETASVLPGQLDETRSEFSFPPLDAAAQGAFPTESAAVLPLDASLPPSSGPGPSQGETTGASGRPETPGTKPVREGESETGEEGRSGFGLEELTPEEQRQVEKLKARDREVRAHEQAHLSAAGSYARGGPRYDYEAGPDDRRYAVGGEVSIDTSSVSDDPEATIRKAQVVRRAALAPAEPSPQDRRVAAEAGRMESRARQELSRARLEEMRGTDSEQSPGGASGVEEASDSTKGDGDTERAEFSGETARSPTGGDRGAGLSRIEENRETGLSPTGGGAIPAPAALPEIDSDGMAGWGGVATLKRFSGRAPAVGGSLDLTV